MNSEVEYSLTYSVTQNSATKDWEATAKCNDRFQTGKGSSKHVAISKAVQSLVKDLERSGFYARPEAEDTPKNVPVATASDADQYEILKGRKRGALATLIRKVTTSDGQVLMEMKYDDGNTGWEKPQFVAKVAAAGTPSTNGGGYWGSTPTN